MPHWLRVTSVPAQPAGASELVFEVLRGEVHTVGFERESEVETLLKAAQEQGSEPLLLEAFSCHVVALAQTSPAEQTLRKAGINRVAHSREEALGFLLERFGGLVP